MASKAAIVNSEERPASIKKQEPNAVSNFSGGAQEKWSQLTRFFSDVRAEMRKVVTPSRKEVQATTTVVIVAVFVFGLYFFVTDFVFRAGIDQILHRLGGK